MTAPSGLRARRGFAVDPLTTPGDELADAPVVMTVDGTVVHRCVLVDR